MNVEQLIFYLNKVKDKKANVYVSSPNFAHTSEVFEAIEINTSTNSIDFPDGVILISDIDE